MKHTKEGMRGRGGGEGERERSERGGEEGEAKGQCVKGGDREYTSLYILVLLNGFTLHAVLSHTGIHLHYLHSHIDHLCSNGKEY